MDVVDSFCYVGDMLSANGGCELSSIIRAKTAWHKFRELLPILTSRAIPIKTRGKVYNVCVRSAMLYGSECWALTQSSLARIRRNDRAMIRWICHVASDEIQSVKSDSLLVKLDIPPLDVMLRENRLRWYGHVIRSSGPINTCQLLELESQKKAGRPKKSWGECIRGDLAKLQMTHVDPKNRDKWRQCLKRTKKKRQTPTEGKGDDKHG